MSLKRGKLVDLYFMSDENVTLKSNPINVKKSK
jgi:hypothetical protein